MYARPLRFEPLEDRRLLSITVDTLVDENDGPGVGTGTSLREAVAAATLGETIDFSVTGTIQLGVGPSAVKDRIWIRNGLTINGPGANLLTLKAYDASPTSAGTGTSVFYISDRQSTLNDVTISGLTLTGGDSFSPFEGGAITTTENLTLVDCVITGNATRGSGGAIYSSSGSKTPNSLTIRGCAITNNSSQQEGGAIRKTFGALTIENSTIANNKARSAGGGISVADGGVNVSIRSSTISGNTTALYGGGVFLKNGNMNVTQSRIIGNTAAASGGGIEDVAQNNSYALILADTLVEANQGGSIGGGIDCGARLIMTRCTIADNHTADVRTFGGGISASGWVSISDSTISGNSSSQGGGLILNTLSVQLSEIVNSTFSGNLATQWGGGIYCLRGSLDIRHTTITANSAPATHGGGIIAAAIASPTASFYSTIVAANSGDDVTYRSAINPFISRGYNIIGAGNGVTNFKRDGDQVAIFDPKLGPLADNGGSTLTHLPLAGSPAINAGDPAAVAGSGAVPTFDQRGTPYTRVWDGDGVGGPRIDIGAVEVQTLPLPAAVYGDYNVDGVDDARDYIEWRRALGTSVTSYSGADGSGNGTVGPEDYDIWRAHIGEPVPAAGASAGALVVAGGAEQITTNTAVRTAALAEPVAHGEVQAGANGGGGRRQETRVERQELAGAIASVNARDEALLDWVNSAKGDSSQRGMTQRDWIVRGDRDQIATDSGCEDLSASVRLQVSGRT